MRTYIGSNTDIAIDYPDVTDETELLLAHGPRFRVVEKAGDRMVLEVIS